MDTTHLTIMFLADLVKSANVLLGKRNRTLTRLNITETQLWKLENGENSDMSLYKSYFVLTLRRLIPRKIRFKSLPSTIPTKDRIVEMMNGKRDDLSEYAELVNTLLAMPDLSKNTRKKKNNVPHPEKRSKKTEKDWGKESLKKAASVYSRGSYGMESQITRKVWGSAYNPARG